jgi:hypothetical protein
VNFVLGKKINFDHFDNEQQKWKSEWQSDVTIDFQAWDFSVVPVCSRLSDGAFVIPSFSDCNRKNEPQNFHL